MIFYLLSWIIWGFVVGFISKKIHLGEEPDGCLSTIFIGVFGSFLGGVLSFILGFSKSPFAASGFLMSIIGGFICCFVYSLILKNKSKGN